MRISATRLISCAAIAALAAAPALARPMEIADLAEIRHAGNLAISPDSSALAYTISVPRDILGGAEDGAPDSHLYIIRGDGEPQRFIKADGSISGVQFSPDGQSVLFRTKREGDDHTAVYSISLSGGEATRLYAHDASIGDFAVSPDGGTLYFIATEADDETEDTLKEKGFKAWAYEEDLDFAHLWTVSLTADDAEAETLLTGPHLSSFELSDDGSFLIAAGAPTPLVDDALMRTRLHIVDAGTGEVTSVIQTPGKVGRYDISPDGSQIAFLAGTDIHDTSTGVLMIADAASGEFEQLTPDALQHIMDVDWLGEGEILANAHRGEESALVVYDPEGEELRTLATPEDIVVRQVVTSGETIRFTADSPAHPRAVFAMGGEGAAKLTNHNAWLEEIDLAPQTTFTYTARDGREIGGVLITPAGEAPEDGWPLILSVHGGPEAHDSDGWMTGYGDPGQYGAGAGYAVFYPNYRGSTGRGVAFAKEHQDDYAGKEFNDLVDAVDALAEAGIADADRAGITGGSYGGYASMWGATAQSEHFAASVAFVGISNQVSKFGTSDIPNEMFLVHSLKWPWDGGEEGHWMELLRRSPLYHAGASTTPTLILHGEEDTRVHPSQSMELFRSMKVRTDTPVRLIFYPGEGHGNRRAAAQMDYAMRMMRWFDTYLAEGASREDDKPPVDLGLAERLGLTEADETPAAGADAE